MDEHIFELFFNETIPNFFTIASVLFVNTYIIFLSV